MLVAWVAQAVRQFAVVSEHHQPFTVGVESPNREQVAVVRNQLAHRLTFITVVAFVGRDHVLRLVQHNVDLLLGAEIDPLAVNRDLVRFRVRLVADACDFAVHAHAPRLDHHFGLAS